MISILKLADEESCMDMKCLVIQVRIYIRCGATNFTIKYLLSALKLNQLQYLPMHTDFANTHITH